MTLKLKSLLEGFAWQREVGKPLPTLADTTAAYEAKMQQEGAFDTTADVYGDPGEKQYSYDDPDGIDFDDENFSDPFLDDPDFMDETAKPDYIDLDKDGNEKETMRKAAADKKSMTESVSLNQRILNNLYGSEYILKEAFKRK